MLLNYIYYIYIFFFFLDILLFFFCKHPSMFSSRVVRNFSLSFHHFFTERYLCSRAASFSQDKPSPLQGSWSLLAWLTWAGLGGIHVILSGGTLWFAKLYPQGHIFMDFEPWTFTPFSLSQVCFLINILHYAQRYSLLNPSRCPTGKRRQLHGHQLLL